MDGLFAFLGVIAGSLVFGGVYDNLVGFYQSSAMGVFRLTDLLGFEFSYNKNFDSDVGNGNPRDDTQWRNALVIFF